MMKFQEGTSYEGDNEKAIKATSKITGKSTKEITDSVLKNENTLESKLKYDVFCCTIFQTDEKIIDKG